MIQVPLHLINQQDWSELPDRVLHRMQYMLSDFEAGRVVLTLHPDGSPDAVYGLYDDDGDFWQFSKWVGLLPAHHSYFFSNPQHPKVKQCIEGWLLASYAYRQNDQSFPHLDIPQEQQQSSLLMQQAIFRVRDWVNCPANELGPQELSEQVKIVSQRTDGVFSSWSGNELQKEFPLVHVVGSASDRPPIMTAVHWEKPGKKHLVLVGKGVCFDSGGLDLKPSQAMRLMKKDMGGAAMALSLAEWLVASNIPVSLTLLIPCVENSVGSRSFRTGDVFNSRSGDAVEIGNTDAEGRLILADALSYAKEQNPDAVIDFATLTGAARVALGTDVPAYFTHQDRWAMCLDESAQQINDPVWRLPLHRPYRAQLKAKVGDINSTGSSGLAGAITAALFLENFIGSETPWLHIDLHAYNIQSRPGRPEGGEAMALRALYHALPAMLDLS